MGGDPPPAPTLRWGREGPSHTQPHSHHSPKRVGDSPPHPSFCRHLVEHCCQTLTAASVPVYAHAMERVSQQAPALPLHHSLRAAPALAANAPPLPNTTAKQVHLAAPPPNTPTARTAHLLLAAGISWDTLPFANSVLVLNKHMPMVHYSRGSRCVLRCVCRDQLRRAPCANTPAYRAPLPSMVADHQPTGTALLPCCCFGQHFALP